MSIGRGMVEPKGRVFYDVSDHLAWISLLLLIVLYPFYSFLRFGFSLEETLPIVMTLLAASTIVCAGLCVTKEKIKQFTFVDWFMVLYVGYIFLWICLSLGLTFNALNQIRISVIPVLLYFVARILFNTQRMKIIVFSLGIITLIVSVFYLLDTYYFFAFPHWQGFRWEQVFSDYEAKYFHALVSYQQFTLPLLGRYVIPPGLLASGHSTGFFCAWGAIFFLLQAIKSRGYWAPLLMTFLSVICFLGLLATCAKLAESIFALTGLFITVLFWQYKRRLLLIFLHYLFLVGMLVLSFQLFRLVIEANYHQWLFGVLSKDSGYFVQHVPETKIYVNIASNSWSQWSGASLLHVFLGYGFKFGALNNDVYFFAVLSRLGLVGFLLFLWVIFLVARMFFMRFFKTNRLSYIYSCAALAYVLMLYLSQAHSGTLDHLVMSTPFFVLIGLSVGDISTFSVLTHEDSIQELSPDKSSGI